MNNTKETSELSSSKTNMVSTTTILKSNKKGMAVLAALCMMCFYAGRLSVFGGEQSDASLLRGFQQDVVPTLPSLLGKSRTAQLGLTGHDDICRSSECKGHCDNVLAACTAQFYRDIETTCPRIKTFMHEKSQYCNKYYVLGKVWEPLAC